MKKIKGIIFDKDGTLIEFSDYWQQCFSLLMERYPLTQNQKNEIRQRVGLNDENEVKENSVLASGNIGDLAEIFSEYLDKTKVQLEEEVGNYFLEHLKNNPQMIKETCNHKELFNELCAFKKAYL